MAQTTTENRSSFFRALQETVLTVSIIVLVTVVTLLIAEAPPVEVFLAIYQGCMGSWIKFSHVLSAWIPLTLCACGLLFTFRIGLWNIGVEGQVMMGAVFTTWVLRFGTDSFSPSGFLALSFFAAVIGGGLWALIAGVLRTWGGVNEIFAGLGMNFVAQGLILWLIFGPWKRPGIASMSGTETFPRELWVTHLPSLRISPLALCLAAAAIAITAILISRSRIGLGLKAIGSNRTAAVLFGLRPNRHFLIAMIFAGGFAGIAGGLQVTSVYHRLLPAISSNYGYLALLVVMLANYKVWGVPAVALFFACLNVGSIQLPMMLKVDSSLSGVIQGTMVLATLGAHAWRARRGLHGKPFEKSVN
jgi:simple sugar transport system permease protein